jgi:hypothetical protein
VGPSNNLDPFFFLTPCFFHNSFTIRLLVYLCMYFFLALSCYYALLSLCWFYNFILQQCFTIVTLHCYLPHLAIAPYCHSALLLLWTPPCYCCKLHLATAASSTLLQLESPPCYMLYLVVVTPLCYCCYTIVIALPTFLPCHVAVQPYYFSTFDTFLFDSSTNGLAWNSHYCFALLLLCLVVVLPCYCSTLLLPLAFCASPTGTSTLPFFLVVFGFFSLKKQTITN